MPRYQFEDRAYRGVSNYEALIIVEQEIPKGARACEAYPIMRGPHTYTRGPRKGQEAFWLGTNQPRTVTFTASPEQALEIAGRAYDRAFIRNRNTYSLV